MLVPNADAGVMSSNEARQDQEQEQRADKTKHANPSPENSCTIIVSSEPEWQTLWTAYRWRLDGATHQLALIFRIVRRPILPPEFRLGSVIHHGADSKEEGPEEEDEEEDYITLLVQGQSRTLYRTPPCDMTSSESGSTLIE